MNERIDHAERACEHIERGKNPNTSKPLSEAMLAQAEATLALMEQQRIQNLIALGQLNAVAGRDPLSSVSDIERVGEGPFDSIQKLKPEIAAALGIQEVRDA